MNQQMTQNNLHHVKGILGVDLFTFTKIYNYIHTIHVVPNVRWKHFWSVKLFKGAEPPGYPCCLVYNQMWGRKCAVPRYTRVNSKMRKQNDEEKGGRAILPMWWKGWGELKRLGGERSVTRTDGGRSDCERDRLDRSGQTSGDQGRGHLKRRDVCPERVQGPHPMTFYYLLV